MASKPRKEKARKEEAPKPEPPSLRRKLVGIGAGIMATITLLGTLGGAPKEARAEGKPEKPEAGLVEKTPTADSFIPVGKVPGDDLFVPFEMELWGGLSIEYHKDNLQLDIIKRNESGEIEVEEGVVLDANALMAELGRFRGIVSTNRYNIVFYDNYYILSRSAGDILAGETEFNWWYDGPVRTTGPTEKLPGPLVDKALYVPPAEHQYSEPDVIYVLTKGGKVFHKKLMRAEEKFELLADLPVGSSARMELVNDLLVVTQPKGGAAYVLDRGSGEKKKLQPKGKKSVEGYPEAKAAEGGVSVKFSNGEGFIVRRDEEGKLERISLSEQPSSGQAV